MNLKPKPKRKRKVANLDSGDERVNSLDVPGGDASSWLDVETCVFDQMSMAIQVLVVFARRFSVLSRRNLSVHTLGLGLLDDGIAVIALICDKRFGLKTLDQLFSSRTIRSSTFCHNNSNRHAMRIRGQMHLGVAPPFCAAYPLIAAPRSGCVSRNWVT